MRMFKGLALSALTVVFSVSSPMARCGQPTVETDTKATLHDKGLGHEFASSLDCVQEYINNREYTKAVDVIGGTITDFEKLLSENRKKNPGATYRCFSAKEEYDAYRKTTKKKIAWVDIAFARAYHLLAFVHINKKLFKLAEPILMLEGDLAPMKADVHIELGSIANQTGRHAEAIKHYAKALELAEKFKSQASNKGPALRGMGFALIEQGKLDEAEKKYQESLKADPGNKLALSELEYIKKLKAEKADGKVFTGGHGRTGK